MDEALQDFETGIGRLEPPDGKARAPQPFLSRLYTASAKAQFAKGRFDKAVADANEAIRLDKTSAGAYLVVRDIVKSKNETQRSKQKTPD